MWLIRPTRQAVVIFTRVAVIMMANAARLKRQNCARSSQGIRCAVIMGTSYSSLALISLYGVIKAMINIYKLPLVLEPQPEGGYTITCPVLPELITEADNLQEVYTNVADALAAIIEIYQDLNNFNQV
jgi:antitoxin HicB